MGIYCTIYSLSIIVKTKIPMRILIYRCNDKLKLLMANLKKNKQTNKTDNRIGNVIFAIFSYTW